MAEFWLTIISTVITVIGTGVTLRQAQQVRSYGKRIASDLRKINLYEVAEALRRAQDEGRRLLTQVNQLNRGRSLPDIHEAMQSQIDRALHLLPMHGLDSDIRKIVVSAQDRLRESQASDEAEKRRDAVSEMHANIQDAVSLAKERIVSQAQETDDD